MRTFTRRTPLLGKTAKRSRHRPHLVGGVRALPLPFGRTPPHYSNPHRHCRRASKGGRSGMAGRYDSNPFEEEDVNPFSVRAPDPPPLPLVVAIPPLPWRRSSFPIWHHVSSGRSLLRSAWIWACRGSDHSPAMEESIYIFRSFIFAVTDAAWGNSCCSDDVLVPETSCMRLRLKYVVVGCMVGTSARQAWRAVQLRRWRVLHAGELFCSYEL